MFVLSCFSVCYFLPNISITIFHNTTVNLKPLSPPIFEKIDPHLKNIILLILVLCVYVFYILSYFY